MINKVQWYSRIPETCKLQKYYWFFSCIRPLKPCTEGYSLRRIDYVYMRRCDHCSRYKVRLITWNFQKHILEFPGITQCLYSFREIMIRTIFWTAFFCIRTRITCKLNCVVCLVKCSRILVKNIIIIFSLLQSIAGRKPPPGYATRPDLWF